MSSQSAWAKLASIGGVTTLAATRRRVHIVSSQQLNGPLDGEDVKVRLEGCVFAYLFTRWKCGAHPTHTPKPFPEVVAVVEKEANAGSYFGLNVLLAAVVR
jgi:hypothetical protein